MIQKLTKTLTSIFLLLIGCPLSSRENQPPAHIRFANEIFCSTIPILEKEFNLECVGHGGSMPYSIGSLSIDFVAQRRANLEEARALQIKCTEKLLQIINSNEQSLFHLAEYPFTAERINVSISFESCSGQYADGSIAFTCQGPHHLAYFKQDPVTEKHIRFFEESYSEALKIVQQSTLSHLDLCTHKAKPYEKDLDLFLESFAREVRSKWGINCVESGGDMVDGIKEFAFLFSKNKRTSVEDARKLEVGINNLLLSKINANEKLRPHLIKYPFSVDQTKIKLIFQKSDTENFRDGSLYSVLQENNKLQYHIHDTLKEDAPTLLDPILIKEETYDEALKALNKNNVKKL